MVKGRIRQGLVLLAVFAAGVALGPDFTEFAFAQQSQCTPIEIIVNNGVETNDVFVEHPGDEFCAFFLNGAAPFLRDIDSRAPLTGTWEFDCL